MMISLTNAERQAKIDACKHARSLTCIPGSGAWIFCDDCGTYFSMFDYPKDTPIRDGKFIDHILGRENAHRLW